MNSQHGIAQLVSNYTSPQSCIMSSKMLAPIAPSIQMWSPQPPQYRCGHPKLLQLGTPESVSVLFFVLLRYKACFSVF